jgi:hypothetical protein
MLGEPADISERVGGKIHRLGRTFRASVLAYLSEFAVGMLPEPQRDWKRIDVELLPPCGLITRAMKLAMMDSANRDGEFVARTISKTTRLGKREVMWIRRYAAAHKTGLPQHKPLVVPIA